jgi:hypothetical protein
MKGTFFNKPLEWSLETIKESWCQGDHITGTLRVKNCGTDSVSIEESGVALAHGEIKKVHTRSEGALKPHAQSVFPKLVLSSGQAEEIQFDFALDPNCAITDKKASYFLSYGRGCLESHLMLKIEPKLLFGKVVGLLDTFHRFKLKELKAHKHGVEYKLIPPTSRDMANLESVNLVFSMSGENLQMDYDFQVRKLDTDSPTTKVNKVGIKVQKILLSKEYSLGKEMINQDSILKSLEAAIGEVKLKSVF